MFVSKILQQNCQKSNTLLTGIDYVSVESYQTIKVVEKYASFWFYGTAQMLLSSIDTMTADG